MPMDGTRPICRYVALAWYYNLSRRFLKGTVVWDSKRKGKKPVTLLSLSCMYLCNVDIAPTIQIYIYIYRRENRPELYEYALLLWILLFVHTVLKPNSWTYNFVEVSGHNLESSQTWSFCMNFLHHREGGMVFYQVFLLSPLQCTVTSRNCKRLREFGETVEVTVNSKK